MNRSACGPQSDIKKRNEDSAKPRPGEPDRCLVETRIEEEGADSVYDTDREHEQGAYSVDVSDRSRPFSIHLTGLRISRGRAVARNVPPPQAAPLQVA